MMKNDMHQRGNALPLVLGILFLAAIGFAGWSYLKKSNTADATGVENSMGESKVPPQVPATEQPEDTTVPEDNLETPTTDAAPLTDPAQSPEAAADTATPDSTAAATTGGKIDLAKATSPRIVGSANAPIKIIEYASLTCSHCAHFSNDIYPALKTKYIDTGKVQFEFREFPLNDPALKAAITARCLPENKYEGFVSLLFKTQDHWAGGIDYMAALKQNAKLAGMSDETFDACQADPKLKLFIADNMQKAQEKFKINSTPTFIINDGKETISGSVPLEEFERIFRKVSGDAVGEPAKVE